MAADAEEVDFSHCPPPEASSAAATLPSWTAWRRAGDREVPVDASEIVHLVVAGALTFALGFERDLRGAGAGERVFALIGFGAGIVGILAAHGAPAALTGALTGVGFIGAGLVFRQEQPHIVRGLTTAASILAAVAIGAAAGEGLLVVATAATALVLLVLEGRYLRILRMLDSRRWASRFRQDESPVPMPTEPADDQHGRTGDRLATAPTEGHPDERKLLSHLCRLRVFTANSWSTWRGIWDGVARMGIYISDLRPPP